MYVQSMYIKCITNFILDLALIPGLSCPYWYCRIAARSVAAEEFGVVHMAY
jgi:hypothetical protein